MDSQVSGAWKLTCQSDYMVEKVAGSFAFCSGGKIDQPMPSCVPESKCYGEDAMPADTSNGADTNGTDCASELEEGAVCAAKCPTAALGEFKCVSGRMVGFSYCSAGGVNVANIERTLILGVLRIEVSSGVNSLTQIARQSIASSLGTSDKFVAHVVVITCAAEVDASVNVQYEVIVPEGSMSEKDLAKAAYELTDDGSSSNTKFQTAMRNGGVSVNSVSTLVAPVSFKTKLPIQASGDPVDVVPVVRSEHSTCREITTTPPKPESDDDDTKMAVAFAVVGGIIGLVCLLCCCVGCYYMWLFGRKNEV